MRREQFPESNFNDDNESELCKFTAFQAGYEIIARGHAEGKTEASERTVKQNVCSSDVSGISR